MSKTLFYPGKENILESENMQQGYWKDESRNVRLRGSDLQRYLEKFPELKAPKFEHRREQLFLMLAQGMPEEWIDYFFSNNSSSSICIDFQRMLLMLTGNFDFVKSRCTGKFCYDEVIEEYLSQTVQERYPVTEEIEKLKREKERLTGEFKDKVGFLLKKFNYEQQISELNEQHRAELLAKDFEKREQAFMFERRNYEETRKRLQEEKERFEKLYEEARTAQAIWEMQVQQGAVGISEEKREEREDVPEKYPIRRIFWFFHSRKEARSNRDAKECKRIFMEAMQKNTYSNKHLQILSYAFTNGFSAEEMEYLVKPDMETNNAVILCALFAKRKELRSPFTMDGGQKMNLEEDVFQSAETAGEEERAMLDEAAANSAVYEDELLDEAMEDDEAFEDAP